MSHIKRLFFIIFGAKLLFIKTKSVTKSAKKIIYENSISYKSKTLENTFLHYAQNRTTYFCYLNKNKNFQNTKTISKHMDQKYALKKGFEKKQHRVSNYTGGLAQFPKNKFLYGFPKLRGLHNLFLFSRLNFLLFCNVKFCLSFTWKMSLL